MAVPGSVRSKARVAALAALVGGATQEEAARAAGVSRMSIVRWLREPAFHRQLADLEGEGSREILGKLRTALPRAIAALVGLLDGPDPGLRIRAASALLRTAVWVLPRPESSRNAEIGRAHLIPADSEPRPEWDLIADAVEIDPPLVNDPEPPRVPQVLVARGVRAATAG